MNTKDDSELNNQLPAESEAKIVDLITDSKWSEAIKVSSYSYEGIHFMGLIPIFTRMRHKLNLLPFPNQNIHTVELSTEVLHKSESAWIQSCQMSKLERFDLLLKNK